MLERKGEVMHIKKVSECTGKADRRTPIAFTVESTSSSSSLLALAALLHSRKMR